MTIIVSLPARTAMAIGLLLATASVAGAQGVSIQASAGLAGHVRPGRWAPVRVDVTSASRQITGDLVIEWGPAQVHRAVSLTAGLSRHFELYVRTLDPRDIITVRLVSDGATPTEALVPVQVLANDASTPPLVVCGPQALAREPGCVAGVDVTSLPRSWRGFDAADEVRLSEAEIGALDTRQRSAFALASAQARLFGVGLGAPTLGQVPTERRWTGRSLILLGSYAMALGVGLSAIRYRHRSATLPTIAICGALGSAAVIAAGRTGPGASLVVHHAAAVDQYEGADRAVLTMRAVAEFPTLGRYTLQSDLEDATILAQGDNRLDVATIDSSGFPVLSGRFGLGSTTSFLLEGAAPALLRVTRDGRDVRVTNVSNHTLRRCAFSARASAVTAELPPGSAAIGTVGDGDPDPLFTCVLESSPWGVSDPRHPVMMNGETTVVVHLNPGPDNAAAGSDR